MQSKKGLFPVIDLLRDRMESYQPKTFLLPPLLPQAAVLMPVTLAPEPEIVLTVRSQAMPTHAGQVAFPGGHHERGESIQQTAFREAKEEVGIQANQVELLGQLTPLASKHGMKVTPFVGLIENNTPLIGDPREIDEIFRVPLAFFLENEPQLSQPIQFLGHKFRVPNYYYEGKHIWGLSAMMIIDLINHTFDKEILL